MECRTRRLRLSQAGIAASMPQARKWPVGAVLCAVKVKLTMVLGRGAYRRRLWALASKCPRKNCSKACPGEGWG
jgi:hypothetical protein